VQADFCLRQRVNMKKYLIRIINSIRILLRVLYVNVLYKHHSIRIRHTRSRKIRVLFIVSEIAKWKEQSLYEAMDKSGIFEPIIGISAWNGQRESVCPNEEFLVVQKKARRFFESLGDKYVDTVKIVSGKRMISDLSEYKPDIVYYTEPWCPAGKQGPEFVSRFALTCYSPYYVPNYSAIEQECKLSLHRWLWEYYCLGDWQGKHFAKSYKPFSLTTKFIGLGHPALDYFYLNRMRKPIGRIVIYAPHCTIPGKGSIWPQHYATFRWSGRFMLEYAKSHPEIKWVFKPHPLLKCGAKLVGLMSDAEIDAYYAEWYRIAKVCDDSAYQDLFLDSCAMVTDCGSFLSEYGATGRPIIHLISSDNIRKPISRLANLYDTYYKVHNLTELEKVLRMVVEEGCDPNLEKRLSAVEDTGLGSINASENIVNHLRIVLGH